MSAARDPEIHDSVLDLVGETPVVRLTRLDPELRTPLIAKVEFMNPGGSIKDRPALAMIEAAERGWRAAAGRDDHRADLGQHGPGAGDGRDAARLQGDRGDAGQDEPREDRHPARVRRPRSWSARPTAEPDSPQSYYRVADRLTEQIEGAFQPNQYFNPANPHAHYQSTGPELWRQTGGRLTHLVISLGTGGTVTGVGRYLKEQDAGIEVVGADPEGSIYSGGPVHPYRVEGIGEDFWPESLDPELVDRYVRVSDRDSFLAARRLVAREGLFAGGSTGTALCAAVQRRERARRSGRDGGNDHPRRGPPLRLQGLQRLLDAASTATSKARAG